MLKSITPQSADRMACLVVGPAGIGKTSLLRTLCGQWYGPEGWVTNPKINPEKVCVFSAESGLLCVRDLVTNGNIQGFEIRSLADFQEAQRACLSQEFRKEGFKWLFIDSLTEIASRCVEALTAKYPSKTDSIKMWGEYSAEMTSIIKAFRDVSEYNVVFTSLEALDKDRDGVTRLTPDISGTGLKNRLTSYFDEVFHMELVRFDDGSEQIMFSTRKPVGLAKDRSGKLNDIEIPNLLAVKHKILN